MGRAFSEIIADELEGVPAVFRVSPAQVRTGAAALGPRPAGAPGISAERTASLAEGANRIAYGQYEVRNGVVEAQVTVEDTRTGKMTVLKGVSAPVANLVSAASALAVEISPRIAPYGTSDPEVVRIHVQAMEGLDAATAVTSLQKAIATDPNFGPTYQQLAQFKAQQRDIPGALALLDQALARGDAMGAIERGRIQLQSATLRNDPAAIQQSLAALAKADPNDPLTWHELARSEMAAHQYAKAVEGYRKTIDIQPEDADTWNLLGYAAAYAGDTATATASLLHYQKMLPSSSNPLDSLGDVNLIAGRLPEAESYYQQSAKKSPTSFGGLDFIKAAMAHLMTADIAGADALAQRYFDARTAAKDPLVDYRKAQWSWISGRRKAACRQMEQVAHAAESDLVREVGAHADAELALWNLMLGNREAAAAVAQKAVAQATPSSATEAILARFLAQPPVTPAEWEARANLIAPNPAQAPLRDLALATALLFAKEYAAAAPVLQRMYDSGNNAAGEGLPVLLAWADLETGHIPEAAGLLRFNPPLSDTGLSWSTALYFPRIYYLRAQAAEKQGKADEARQNYRLFQQLSGSDTLLWGEEKKSQ